MIQQIDIQNFQSHKDSTLEFSPGVNVIVGTSDSGKTAVIRALKWAVFNRPSGDEYRSHWSNAKSETSVAITVPDHTVLRLKSNPSNLYQLDNTDFNAFGTDVPKEIKDVLNINEINLQQQLDSPFLLNKECTPGDVAHHFNKIAHLDQIDIGLKKIQSWENALSQTIKSDESTLKESIQKLTKYENLDKLEVRVEVLEQLEADASNIVKNIGKLKSIISNLSQIEQDITEANEFLKIETKLNALFILIESRNVLEDKIEDFSNVILALRSADVSIQEYSGLVKLEPTINSILQSLDESNKQTEKVNKLKDFLFTYDRVVTGIERQTISLKALEKEFHDNMPEICPLCGK